MVPILGGILGLVGLIAFVSALPLSYQIEARSDPQRKRYRKMGYTNIWAVIINYKVARDHQTQALRRKLLVRMALVAACMTGLALLSTGVKG